MDSNYDSMDLDNSYFDSIPIEIISTIIDKLYNVNDLENLLTSLENSIHAEQLSNDNTWKYIFNMRFPQVYNKYMEIRKIDHTFRTYRYNNIFRLWYTDLSRIQKYYDVNSLDISFISEIYPVVLNISWETFNLIYAIKLYNLDKEYYIDSLVLPDTKMTKMKLFTSYDEHTISNLRTTNGDDGDDDDDLHSLTPVCVYISIVSDNLIVNCIHEYESILLSKNCYYDQPQDVLGYNESSYLSSLIKYIFLNANDELIDLIIKSNQNLVDLLEDVRPEYIGKYYKKINRKLKFPMY